MGLKFFSKYYFKLLIDVFRIRFGKGLFCLPEKHANLDLAVTFCINDYFQYVNSKILFLLMI